MLITRLLMKGLIIMLTYGVNQIIALTNQIKQNFTTYSHICNPTEILTWRSYISFRGHHSTDCIIQAFVMFFDTDTYDSMVIPGLNKDPAFGEDYPLRCINLTEGRPNKIIQYAWSKDGKDINESNKYVSKEDSLIIKVFFFFMLKW